MLALQVTFSHIFSSKFHIFHYIHKTLATEKKYTYSVLISHNSSHAHVVQKKKDLEVNLLRPILCMS